MTPLIRTAVAIWISLSGGMIIFNKWIFTTKGFAFIMGTNILRFTTNLLPEAETPLPDLAGTKVTGLQRRIWTTAIVPIGCLYSVSLVLSNAAYVHLSVYLVQMIKASIPVLAHLISCHLQGLNAITAIILLMVGSGCIIASTGQMRYNVLGLACQSGAVVAEASRLVVIQVLLKDIKLNPLLSLYYYAPVCLAAIAFEFPFLEGSGPFRALPSLGWPILLANGLLSFALNVASVLLIRSSGSVVSSLSGVLKDIILIFLSVTFLGSAVSPQQILGYGLALLGLILFKERARLCRWMETPRSRSG
ncbi:hypothetical protein JCM24511_08336 [Saitozyma sp. JCM 24511]|nr:hypothetical protein JCM24511_08336 [Saitozyma sp. JCM 24511]